MQAIELDTDIAQDGSIHLPQNYKHWFGKHAKLIVLLPESAPKKRQNLSEVLEAAWGAWGNKTLDEIDKG